MIARFPTFVPTKRTLNATRRTPVGVLQVLLLLAIPSTAFAQAGACNLRHPMVDAVNFVGNKSIGSSSLAPIIETQSSGLWRRWFGWKTGVLTCLDSVTLKDDTQRLHDQYAQAGYPKTIVTSSVTRRGTRRAQVTFTVKESAPILIDTVTLVGLPPNVVNASAMVRRLVGQPKDDSVLAFVADSMQTLIQAGGYARAGKPSLPLTVVDSARNRAAVTFAFHPNAIVYFDSIHVEIKPAGSRPALNVHDINALLRFKQGERYSARAIGESQRDLFEMGLYSSVRIDSGTTAASDTTNRLPIFVKLVEGTPHRLRTSGGWGTLDCFRTQERFINQNMFGLGHRLELTGRMSKIGLAHPFNGFSGLCAPRVRNDPFSQRLNYYAGATLNLRGIIGAKYQPTLTVFSERRSEFQTYEQSTNIGVIASVGRDLGRNVTVTARYQYVDGKTIADQAVSCTIFGFCRLQDLTTFLQSSPIHSVGLGIVKNPLLPTSDPVNDFRWQLETKLGTTQLARKTTLNFGRLMGEVAGYYPLGPTLVIATRLQGGYVLARSDQSSLLPPTERFYSGGQNSVRGFGQNLLGPGSYIVGKIDTIPGPAGNAVAVARPENHYDRIAPSGGNAMWLANVELRTRKGYPGGLLRYVIFVDAGRVWNTNDVFNVTNSGVRVTPGVGVRLVTPLGPFRVDIGYNPYALSAGPAFFVIPGDARKGIAGRVICVSPGSTDPIVRNSSSGTQFCPASFTPQPNGGWLQRLTFHFSIGNAF